MKALNILFPVLITFFSCSKSKDLSVWNTDRTGRERVRIYIDRYTIDTVYLGITTKWYDDYLTGTELAKCKAVDSVKWITFCTSPTNNTFMMDKQTYIFGEGEYKPTIYK